MNKKYPYKAGYFHPDNPSNPLGLVFTEFYP